MADETQPVRWLKHKYTVGKLWGKPSNSNDNHRKRLKRKVTSDRVRAQIQSTQPHMVRVVSPTGKARMVRKEK